jgi:hypothetical protein
LEGKFSYSGAGVLGEVVRGDEAACHALVEACPAVVGRVHNGVLEAAGVLEVQVQLAVLGLVGRGDTGADVRLELIEAVSNDLWSM